MDVLVFIKQGHLLIRSSLLSSPRQQVYDESCDVRKVDVVANFTDSVVTYESYQLSYLKVSKLKKDYYLA